MTLVSIKNGYNGHVSVFDLTLSKVGESGTRYYRQVAEFHNGKRVQFSDFWYAQNLLEGHAKADHQYTADEVYF